MKEQECCIAIRKTQQYISAQKYTLFLVRIETGVRLRVTGRQIQAKDSRDCYIDIFLNHVVIPFKRPYVLARGTQPGSAVGRCTQPDTHRLLTDSLRPSWLLHQLRDWLSRRRCPSIYNFIKPCIFQIVNTRDLLTPTYRLFSGNQFVYTCASCVERSLIDDYVKYQYATRRLATIEPV